MRSLRRDALQLDAAGYLEVKDPCPVRDANGWHLYGTGITAPHTFELLHATASQLAGPWQLCPPVGVGLDGGCVAAPGLIADGSLMHMFLQTEYNKLDGRIEHLVSADGGASFGHVDTALTSLPDVGEAGIYDPHPSLVNGAAYLVYSAFSRVGEPDLYLARSASGGWCGPWLRLGPILRHQDVDCHNQLGADDYEWGLEGGQLLELPDGRVLLNAVCFLPQAAAGHRQRVFFATAADVLGPYDVHGAVVEPERGNGENGHGTVVVDGDQLRLFFQERRDGAGQWRYSLASMPLAELPGVGAASRREAVVA
jgi:hypothetical protein